MSARVHLPTICRSMAIAAVALALPFVVHPQVRAQSAPVTWENLVNAEASGSTLQKTTGCDGCDDAGGTSQQQLTAGDGYVEFTIGELGTIAVAGFGTGNDSTRIDDVDFGFRFNGSGSADVMENGVYQPGGDTTYAPGDLFRVAVVGGRVQYFKNDVYLRESATAPVYPLLLDTALFTLGASVRNAVLAVAPPPPGGGGLLEKAGSPVTRARYTRAQISAFLPPGDATGPFTFPAPYGTTGVRLTNPSICAGGQDCLWYVGYSYWRNINNHAASTDMYIFLGTDPARGGAGPILLHYDKLTDIVQNLGPMFAPGTPGYWSTGEGWYFSGTRPTTLYTLLVGSAQLRRFDILTRQFDPLPAMDLNACPRPRICPSSAAYLTQAHSSDDDLVHSATVQDTAWNRLGCVVLRGKKFSYYTTPQGFTFDECHIDKSGRWLMILEGDAGGAQRNRVVDLTNGKTTVIDDAEGSLGHLDMGFGYAVGADNYNPYPNATILLKFPVTSTTRPVGPVVHFNKRWDIVAANHITHGNASPTAALSSQYACGSHASRVSDMADEIVCFPLDPNRNADGSLDVLSVGQVLTDLDAPGGSDYDHDDYEKLPKGNLDLTGRYFIWTTNLGGDRLDALVVKIPAERLIPALAEPAPLPHSSRKR